MSKTTTMNVPDVEKLLLRILCVGSATLRSNVKKQKIVTVNTTSDN